MSFPYFLITIIITIIIMRIIKARIIHMKRLKSHNDSTGVVRCHLTSVSCLRSARLRGRVATFSHAFFFVFWETPRALFLSRSTFSCLKHIGIYVFFICHSCFFNSFLFPLILLSFFIPQTWQLLLIFLLRFLRLFPSRPALVRYRPLFQVFFSIR